MVNTFTVDTVEYYSMCYRVNMMSRPLKTLYIILRFVLTNHHYICIVYYGLVRLTGAFKIILIYCCTLSDLIRRISWYQCASEAVQKISTKDTGIVHKLTKTANFIAKPMKKHI